MRWPPPPPPPPPPPALTQQPPPLHVLSGQHVCPGSPHGEQMFPLQTRFAPPHVRPVQHACPAAPHGVPSGSAPPPSGKLPLLLVVAPSAVPPSGRTPVAPSPSPSLPHATRTRRRSTALAATMLRIFILRSYRRRGASARIAHGRRSDQPLRDARGGRRVTVDEMGARKFFVVSAVAGGLLACVGGGDSSSTSSSSGSSSGGGGGGSSSSSSGGATGSSCHKLGDCLTKGDLCIGGDVAPGCGGAYLHECDVDADCPDGGSAKVCSRDSCGRTQCVDPTCGAAGDPACPTNTVCAKRLCAAKPCSLDTECVGFCVNGVCSSTLGTCGRQAQYP